MGKQFNNTYALLGNSGNHYPKNKFIDIAELLRGQMTASKIYDLCISDFISQWNAACDQYHAPSYKVELDQAPYSENRHTIELVKRYRKSNDTFAAMQVYPNQIRAALRSVMKFSKNKSKHLALLAETQFGKTGILGAFIVMYNLWQEANKIEEKEFLRLIIPNFLGAEKQTDDDMDSIRHILAAVKMNGVSADDANKIYFKMDARSRRKANSKKNIKENEDFVNSLKDEDGDTSLYCHGYTKKVIIIDEADEALGCNSYLDRILKQAKKAKVKTRLVMCSATAWEYKFLSKFEIVDVEVDGNYCGLYAGKRVPVISLSTMADITGEEELNDFSITRDYAKTHLALKVIRSFAKGVPVNTPCSIMEYDFGVKPSERFVKVMTTAGAIGFNGKPWNGGEGGVIRYGKNATDHLLKLKTDIQKRLIEEEGISFLVYTSEKKCEFRVKTKDGEIEDRYILRDEEDDEGNSAKTPIGLINLAKKKGATNYIVAVVGLARRAMRFPPECTCFMDFSESATTMTALEQGTIGRSTGHFKVTNSRSVISMVSNDVNEVVVETRAFYDLTGKKIPVIKPSQYSVAKFKRPSFKTNSVIFKEDVEDDMYSPALKKSYRELERIMTQNIQFTGNAGKRSPTDTSKSIKVGLPYKGDGFTRAIYKGGAKSGWTFYDIFGVFGKDGIKEIEDNFSEKFGSSVSILGPNGRRSDGRHLASFNNHVRVNLRNYDEQVKLGINRFGVMGERSERGVSTTTAGVSGAENILNISCQFSERDGKVELQAISFVLSVDAMDTKGVDYKVDGDRTLPRPTTPGGKKNPLASPAFTTSKERAEANDMVRTKKARA